METEIITALSALGLGFFMGILISYALNNERNMRRRNKYLVDTRNEFMRQLNDKDYRKYNEYVKNVEEYW